MTGCHHRRERVSFHDGAFHVDDDLDPAWSAFIGHDADDDDQRPDDSDRTNADVGAIICLALIVWGIVECVRAVAGTG